MKTSIISTLALLLITLGLYAQDSTLYLIFTGRDGSQHRQLDSIYIKNLDRGGDTTLFWPDTVLVLDFHVGLSEWAMDHGNIHLKAYPNPFSGHCSLEYSTDEGGILDIISSDMLGRTLPLFSGYVQNGVHLFNFSTGEQAFYALRFLQNGRSETVKLISTGPENTLPEIQYRGQQSDWVSPGFIKNTVGGFDFEMGDRLLYLGYNNGEEAGITEVPAASREYEIQFLVGGPCPGDSVVVYEDKEYPTIQVRGQCWLQKNLDVGTMINGMATQTNNSIIEKYCIANDPAYCDIYGGLYQWNEMMAYATEEGCQGICPDGWHVPVDADWTILESAADSEFDYRDTDWDIIGFRGTDAGLRLKSDSLWVSNGNGTNELGFNALPGGTRGNAGFFLLLGENAPFWSSSTDEGEYVLYRILVYNSDQVYRFSFDKYSGFAVRCLRNN